MENKKSITREQQDSWIRFFETQATPSKTPSIGVFSKIKKSIQRFIIKTVADDIKHGGVLSHAKESAVDCVIQARRQPLP